MLSQASAVLVQVVFNPSLRDSRTYYSKFIFRLLRVNL